MRPDLHDNAAFNARVKELYIEYDNTITMVASLLGCGTGRVRYSIKTQKLIKGKFND